MKRVNSGATWSDSHWFSLPQVIPCLQLTHRGEGNHIKQSPTTQQVMTLARHQAQSHHRITCLAGGAFSSPSLKGNSWARPLRQYYLTCESLPFVSQLSLILPPELRFPVPLVCFATLLIFY